MQYRFSLVVLACLAIASQLAAADNRDAATQKDFDAFQGTWEIVSAKQAGVDATEACQARSPRITFQGDVWLQDIDNHPLYTAANSHIKLDASKSPKQFDHIVVMGANDQSNIPAYPGIYELDGDSLKLCWDVGLKQRPSNFASEVGAEHFFVMLKRVKPKAHE